MGEPVNMHIRGLWMLTLLAFIRLLRVWAFEDSQCLSDTGCRHFDPPADSSGTLSALLGSSVRVTEFFDHYWERRVYHGQSEDPVARQFNSDSLHNMMRDQDWQWG